MSQLHCSSCSCSPVQVFEIDPDLLGRGEPSVGDWVKASIQIWPTP